MQATRRGTRGKLSLGAMGRVLRSNGYVKRALLVLLALVALFFVVRAVVHALASDDTQIRWLVEDMSEGFSDTRMNPILSGLALEFTDEGTGARKDDVRAGLAQLFLQRKDPKTKRFPYRARIEREGFTVSVQRGETNSAAADFTLVCEESDGEDAWRSAWKAQVHAELEDGPGGWKIRRTRVDTLEGKRLR